MSRVFVSIFAIIHLSKGSMPLCQILAFPDQERSYPNRQSTYIITSLIGQLAIANQEESEMNSHLLKALKNEYRHTDFLRANPRRKFKWQEKQIIQTRRNTTTADLRRSAGSGGNGARSLPQRSLRPERRRLH